MGYWNYGPHSPGSPGLWVDQKGNIGSAMNWAGGEPNDSGGNEPCVQTYPGGSWNDISCGAWYQVVCQCECKYLNANSKIRNKMQAISLKSRSVYFCLKWVLAEYIFKTLRSNAEWSEFNCFGRSSTCSQFCYHNNMRNLLLHNWCNNSYMCIHWIDCGLGSNSFEHLLHK